MRKSSWLPSSVLIFGQTSIHALLRSPLTVQVESLLECGRLADAEELLDRATIAGIQPEIQQYLHQCIAFKLMGRTQFQKAARHFVEGAIDPRLLLTYFEELRPALYEKNPSASLSEDKHRVNAQDDYMEVEIFAGIDQHRPSETSVDDIIRNYSPHLRPQTHLETYDLTDSVASTEPSSSVSGTRTHPATIAMRDALRNEANEMVKGVLSAMLTEQVSSGTREVVEITSTALALCYAHSGDIPSLLASFPPLQSQSTARTTSRSPSRLASQSSSSSYIHPPPLEISTGVSSHPSSSPSLSPRPPTMTIRPHVLAPVLAKLSLWGPLIELWRAVSDVRKLISVLAGLVEETYHDPTVPDPLGQIYAILSALQQPERPDVGVGITVSTISETERQSLIRKWGPWLAVRDVERGLALLTSTPTRTRSSTVVGSRTKDKEQEKADEFAVLAELRKARAEAAKRYLEWLIVVKGREDPSLRAEVVNDCIDDLFKYLEDEAVVKLWRAKAASYASSPTSPVPPALLPTTPSPQAIHPTSTNAIPLRPPFLSYFASTTPDSPSKRARIKALLILQATIYRGSEGVAVATRVQERLTQGGWGKVLSLEMAVLHSKLSPPSTVLRALHALRDNATAETYASSGGTRGVISPRIASNAAEGCGLGEWAKWFVKAMEDKGSIAKSFSGLNSEKLENTGGSAEMLKTLVQVYTEEGDMQQVSRLLSSQAESLDVVDITPLVPASWPLHAVSSFLIRSLRRSLHAKHEGQIVKAISAGQNLDFLEQSYVIIRDEGAIIEEAVEDDEGGGSAEDFDEKGSLVEKVAMQLGQGDVHVADLDTRNGG